MFDRLWEWVRAFVEGPGGAAVPVEVRMVGLAEGWGVTVEVARRMVWEYGAGQGLGVEAAVAELVGMGYAEAVREIGVR
ncbi:MAG: hypothetical protein MUQ10_04725 [Anaerolineae bacterium]|nr:hypothetical protein [Anaerolineae bacterium]